MAERPSNFINHLHTTDFLGPFDEHRIISDDLLNIEGRETELLNGRWHYSEDRYGMSLRHHWYTPRPPVEGRPVPVDFDYEHWPTMTLPATWNTHAEKLFWYEGFMVFTRAFRFTPRGDERVFLAFEGVQYRCYLFVNGAYVGVHFGGSTPFSVDVTDHLGSENRLFLVVDNTRRDTHVPMSNTDWFNYGGIYRDIHVVRVPRDFIRDYHVYLIPDGSYGRIAVEVELTHTGSTPRAAAVHVSIPELSVDVAVPITDGRGTAEIGARPELWSPDRPKLYRVHMRYGADSIAFRTGFREIRTRGRDVFLNGAPLFFRGVAVHEDSIDGGKHLTDEEIRHTLETALDLGCNYMRLAHYPHDRRVARLADEMGILLWAEIPVYWAIAFDNPETYGDARNQMCELVRRDRNHPSVAIWSVGNENPDTDARLSFMKGLVREVRALDSTRPISAACLYNGAEHRIDDRLANELDIIGLNEYYGWYHPVVERLREMFDHDTPEKPIFITEFGGGAVAGHHGTTADLFTEEHQRDIYERQIAVFRSVPEIKGISPWILFDFRAPRRTNRFQRGYNRKGLVAADRRTRKLAFYTMQAFYRERSESSRDGE